MVDITKIEKLILGTDEDRAIANEFILKHKLNIVPKEFETSAWDVNNKYFIYRLTRDIFIRDVIDNTWYKLVAHTTTAISTTTKI